MENNAQQPISTHYLTKLISKASPPPSRDHQHHLNQKNTSTIAKENELRLVADFEGKIAADRARDEKYAANRKEREVKLVTESNKHYARMDARWEAQNAKMDARREAHSAEMYASLELFWETIRDMGPSPIDSLIAISPTEIRPKLNTDYTTIEDEFTNSNTTEEEDEEEEEGRPNIDHKFYNTSTTTDQAFDTTMCTTCITCTTCTTCTTIDAESSTSTSTITTSNTNIESQPTNTPPTLPIRIRLTHTVLLILSLPLLL